MLGETGVAPFKGSYVLPVEEGAKGADDIVWNDRHQVPGSGEFACCLEPVLTQTLAISNSLHSAFQIQATLWYYFSSTC